MGDLHPLAAGSSEMYMMSLLRLAAKREQNRKISCLIGHGFV